MKSIIKFASCVVLLLAAYIPTIIWMVDRWFAPESYYGHGFFIPIISLYTVWQRMGALKKIQFSGSGIGLWIIAAGLLVHVVSLSMQIAFVSGFSFIFVLYGLVLFFLGKEMARNLIFPIFFLAAMIPLPLVVIGNMTVKLKLFAAQVATIVLNMIGFSCVRDGSIIRMPNSYLTIEAPCSGLRSLISLLTLGLFFAHAIKISRLKKSILFLSSIPIAMVSNILRIVMLGIVNDLYGEKVAFGFFHDFTGFFVFAFAFAGLLGVSRILEPQKNEK